MSLHLEDNIITIPNTSIPVFVHIEKRRGYRASFVKDGLNIRVSKYNSAAQRKAIVEKCLVWASKSLQAKPSLAQRYRQKQYNSGEQLITFNSTFIIEHNQHSLKNVKAEFTNGQLRLFSNPSFNSAQEIKLAVSKALANYYKPYLLERLNYYQEFITPRYKKLRIKYNTSNWGSCSRKGNINLSSRLLLTTERCIDYVIAHELCHLLHLNHSPAFWQAVAQIMPDYKLREKELKALSHKSYL